MVSPSLPSQRLEFKRLMSKSNWNFEVLVFMEGGNRRTRRKTHPRSKRNPHEMTSKRIESVDGIPTRLLKKAMSLTVASVIRIMIGDYPTDWKNTRVTLIFKAYVKLNLSNYRPIMGTLRCIFSTYYMFPLKTWRYAAFPCIRATRKALKS